MCSRADLWCLACLASAATGSAGKAQRTVTFKWDRRQFSHSDETLNGALRSYGDVEAVKLKSSSAKVVFAEASAAVRPTRRLHLHVDIPTY